ncbi:methyl-accepting chemotaxis protein [Marinobacter halodurans]|uniref:Methyl-accepting chemotaxis protein n=1 Tax=Marinobacter halodurans TaxID=2528979 RepID=A0ABY1ZU80_9GAMM|nr:methyl-accepting chemotaxis protein [Marinobacter halodurans]TBW59020.1 methyl-accepting chemotaxis protein [Marinobacter halodurans]
MKLNITIKQSLFAGLIINILSLALLGAIALLAIKTLNGNQKELSLSASFEAQGRNISQAVGQMLAHNSRILTAGSVAQLDKIGQTTDVPLFDQAMQADKRIMAQLDISPDKSKALGKDLDELSARFNTFRDQEKALFGQSRKILQLDAKMPVLIDKIDQQTDKGVNQVEALTTKLGFAVTRHGRQFMRNIRSLSGLDAQALDDLRSGFQEIAYGNEPKALKLSERVRLDMVKLTALSRRVMLVNDAEALAALRKDHFAALSTSLSDNLDRLGVLLHDDSELSQQTEALKQQYKSIIATISGSDQALFEVKQQQLQERATLTTIQNQLTSSMNAVMQQLESMSTKAAAIRQAVDASSAEVASGANRKMLVGGAIIAALMLAVGLLLTVRIVNPLNFIAQRMDEIANGDGDLTARIRMARTDEIGTLASRFNAFVELIQQLVLRTSTASQQVSSATGQTAVKTESMTQGMERQKGEIDMVVSAVHEMAMSLEEVARNVSATSDSASRVDEIAQHGQHEVDSVIAKIREVAEHVEQGTRVVERLDEDSQAIGAVLEVIGKISEQTNMLALNAAIEAARAGESGRGFAVVADEVRDLARQTHESTASIHSIIEKLQTNATAATDAIRQGSRVSQAAVEQADTAGRALVEVTEAAADIRAMATQVAVNTEEQSSVANEINRHMDSISQVSDQASAEVNEVRQEIARLQSQANELDSVVGRFKI